MTTTTPTSPTHAAVLALRKAFAERRAFDAPSALAQRTSGRNATATLDALRRKDFAIDAASAGLRNSHPSGRTLLGLLVEEHLLVSRLAEAKRAGHKRPELLERLLVIRLHVRGVLAQIAEGSR